MGNRLTQITTRTGDDGTTGLANGQRYNKNEDIIHAIGDIDELNSMIGFLRSTWADDIKILKNDDLFFTNIDLIWHKIQHHLFDFGGELSMPGYQFITENHVLFLDELITKYNQTLARLQEFILPMGHQQVTTTHLVRTIARRCERLVVGLNLDNKNAVHYLNRLSDWSFICARLVSKHHNQTEVYWEKQFSTV